nr:ATP-dependent DNA helicase PIF1 [Tanacetum cinerariifolium]
AKIKVIKEGSEKLGLLKINDDSFACNTPLGTIFNQFNRLSGMDDDLFTYEVEIPRLSSIPCDKKEGDNSNDGDLDIYKPRVCYDENDRIYAEAMIFVNKRLVRLMDVTVEQWLDLIYALKSYNHMTMDRYKKNALWIYCTRGEDDAELTDEEFSDPDDENLIYTEEEYHGFPRNYGRKMEFSMITSVIFASLVVSRIGKLNAPLAIQMQWSRITGDVSSLLHDLLSTLRMMNDHECYPFTNWRSHIHKTYVNTNIDDSYNHYLDVSRTFNNHEGRNDDEAIQEERELNDDHRISNLDNDLVRDNTSYHANKEEEQYE